MEASEGGLDEKMNLVEAVMKLKVIKARLLFLTDEDTDANMRSG